MCSTASILPFVLMVGLHDVTSYIWSTVHSHFYINLIVLLFIFNPYLPVLCLCLGLGSVFYLKLECFGASELLWFFNDISSFLNQFKQFFRGDILLGFWLFLSWIITLFACELFWVFLFLSFCSIIFFSSSSISFSCISLYIIVIKFYLL